MKKLISALTLVAFLALFIAPVAFAVVAPTDVTQCTMRHTFTGFTGFSCPPAVGDICLFTNAAFTCGSCCLLDTIYTVTDWIFYLATAVAIIFIVLGAFSIITAGGSPEKVTSGRNYILYAVIGLIVGLMAKGIPALARAILGLNA
jgi:hypothetical protein